MKSFLKPTALFTFLFIFALASFSQNNIVQEKGYSPQIGSTVSMLDDLKQRVTSSVRGLNQSETDFLLDKDANSVGAMILHLAATEVYYQIYTFENRSFNKEEAAKWNTALSLGENARQQLKGKPIQHYLDIWTEVRKKTKELLKTKDDAWFAKQTSRGSMNNHWAWYHVMEHQANHMGQIRLIIKRIP